MKTRGTKGVLAVKKTASEAKTGEARAEKGD